MKPMHLRNTLYAAGLLLGGTIITATAWAEPPTRSVILPQRITPVELKRMLMDLPEMIEIVDLRPPAAYADFNLPGSINASIADVIGKPDYLNGEVPLILVDRDGSLAMAVGGILSQKTRRSIRVLHGGLEAYWNDSAALQPPVAPGPPHSAVIAV